MLMSRENIIIHDFNIKRKNTQKKNKGYLEERVISNFAGVFPIQEPRYVIAALLDEPENTFKEKTCRFSGCTVAPMVKQIIERVAPLLGVIPIKRHEENRVDS